MPQHPDRIVQQLVHDPPRQLSRCSFSAALTFGSLFTVRASSSCAKIVISLVQRID